MAIEVPIEVAKQNLENLLERLCLGETITLIGPEGMPLAVLVSLKPAPVKVEPTADWKTQWEELAQEVGRAWKSEKSAVEILSEMRR